MGTGALPIWTALSPSWADAVAAFRLRDPDLPHPEGPRA
jgi:hypothetical protein